MKLDVLGLNHFDSRSATCQTVWPPSAARSADHFRIAPPHSSSARPRLSRYHAASRLWSDVDLKKTPPIPVTRAITFSSLSSFVIALYSSGAFLSTSSGTWKWIDGNGSDRHGTGVPAHPMVGSCPSGTG